MQIDVYLTKVIYHLPHNIVLDSFFRFISAVGTYGIIWIIVMIALITFEEKKDRSFIWPFLLSIALSILISQFILKGVFMRPRPETSTLHDYSFPSGHATTAFAAAFILTFFDKKRRALWYMIAFLIAFSRVYLGHHYVSDVVAGAFIGWVVGVLSLRIYAKIFP